MCANGRAHWRHLANTIELVLPSAHPDTMEPSVSVDDTAIRFGELLCPLGELGPHFNNVACAEASLHTEWHTLIHPTTWPQYINITRHRDFRVPTHLENLENSWNFMLDLEFLV